MDQEPKPEGSTEPSQTVATTEQNQIPTPPSEEDPGAHGSGTASSGEPIDTVHEPQETLDSNRVVDERPNGKDDGDNAAGDTNDAASVASDAEFEKLTGLISGRPPPNDYAYIPRTSNAPPLPAMDYGEPPYLRDTSWRERQELKRKHDDYILLLEDRITRLENRLTQFLSKPPKPMPHLRKPMFVPGLRVLSWKEWAQSAGTSVGEGHSTIEILVDLPISRGREMNSVEEQKGQENEVFTHEQQQGTQDIRRRESRLPENVDLPQFMRLNTMALRSLLERDIFGKAVMSSAPTPLQVHRRPFKAFVHYKDAILKRINELKLKLDPEVLERVGQNIRELVPMAITPLNEADDEYIYVLYSVLEIFIKDYLEPIMERVPEQSRIQFQDLWFLFQPGQYVFVKEKDCPQQIWRVLQTVGGNRYLRRPVRKPLGARVGRDRYASPSTSRSRSSSPEYRRNVGPPINPARSTDEPASGNYTLNGFSPFYIDCYYIDYDGFQFKPVYRRFEIPKFEDNVLIRTLSVVPLEKAEAAGLVNKDMQRKIGLQYLECITATHRFFDGRTLDRNSWGDVLYLQESDEWRSERRAFPETLEGKVMVDLATAAQANPNWRPVYDELTEYRTPAAELLLEGLPGEPVEVVLDDHMIDQRRREDFLEKELQKFKDWNSDSASKPEDDDLMLLPDRVYAFVLRTRKWACLPLGFNEKNEPFLKQVSPEDDAWNDLQLPGGDDGHKYIIQSLIKKHFAKDMAIDLVRDKGRGLIILLHGAPGVGKTSTAECVAAANGKPLLPITCGDLGLSPKEVEENLEFHFRLAQAWDCVLLLDEADVFLARRTVEDVSRNALVSVFLRILEYYEGILFLTTNRVGTLDEAFRSRIHMSLYYPTLGEDQTKAIWKILCRRAKIQQERLDIEEDEILEYAMEHFEDLRKANRGRGVVWNGRQIKNAFMSAIALAHYRVPEGSRVRLGVTHFKKVAKASKEFDDYLTRTQAGRDAATVAMHNQLRFDDFPVNPGDSDGGAGTQHFGVPPRNLFRQPQPQAFFPQPNAYGMQMNPYGMQQGGFPQQMGAQIPQQGQFYGGQMPMGQVPMGQVPQQQQQFYPQNPQMQGMGGVQNIGGQQMGQMGAQAATGAQQQNQQQQQQQQSQQGQQGFSGGFVQGQGGFIGGQS